jgi:methyltransferase (TIGR00027 family)
MEDGGPSQTARRVAAHRLEFTRVAAEYGDPGADDALAADVAAGHQAPANRMHDYLAGRTAFFDRVVTGAIAGGLRQIVVGGAGYDARALRYAKPGVRWFEVDHPATQRDKLARIERLGIDASGVGFVAADFVTDPVAARLRAAGFDPAEPSLFLLEGVAVYLEPDVLERLLDQFREVAAPGSRLAISVSLSRPAGDAARARFQASVAAMGEPARSSFDADQAESLLARAGWHVSQQTAAQQAGHQRARSAGLLTAGAGPRDESAGSARRPRAAARKPKQAEAGRHVQPGRGGYLSLSALLSQALVAFTIECDNEGEHQLPHRTTSHGASAHGDGAWLVSLVMWENCMRYLAGTPLTVAELASWARTPTNLDGMRRWGYITIDGTARKIHRGHPGPDAVLDATPRGLRARGVWRPLPALVEQRWRDRFGAGQIDGLRAALLAIAAELDPGLPDCLPILGQNLASQPPDPDLPPRPEPPDLAALPLSALLSRVLLAFAVEYEAAAGLSLAVSANLLRVLGAEGIRLRDLPGRTGVSREALSWAQGIMVRGGFAAEEADPAAARGKVLRLTGTGTTAKDRYAGRIANLEAGWAGRSGDAIAALRGALEPLATGAPPPLFAGLEPYPDNWRAQVRPPAILPYFPMVLHRGGYPDGS